MLLSMLIIHRVFGHGLCLFSILLGVSHIVDATYSKSGLCPSVDSNMSSISCATQLWGMKESNDSCRLFLPPIEARRNSAECNAYEFVNDATTAPDDFGEVLLKAYYYHDEDNWKQTAFNVTLSKIGWTRMRIRFQEYGSNSINFCRTFAISSLKKVLPESLLFYDCLWSKQTYELKTYLLDYHATNENDNHHASVGKYLFYVPDSTKINPSEKSLNKSKLFVYMDLSYLPQLRLRLQLPHGRFPHLGLDIEHFCVMVHREVGDKLSSLRLVRATVHTDELIFEYDTRSLDGLYHFTAQIEHSNCSLYSGGCLIASTPAYLIEGNENIRLLIGIVGCGGSILSMFVIVYFLWRWSQLRKKGTAPTVLMIYEPTMEGHIRYVIEFAKFLKKECCVNALLDELEIPKTETQDPFTWCNNAFLHSDFVMVLSSPHQQSNLHEGIYRNVDALGLRNLKEKLGDRKSTQQFFNVILPYCSRNDIPPEAGNLKSFVLMKDLNKMLSLLHSRPFKVNVESSKSSGPLLEALEMAQSEPWTRGDIDHDSDRENLLLEEIRLVGIEDSSEELLPPNMVETMTEPLDMYPGPIDDLNLLGTEDDRVPGNQRVPMQKGVIDLNDLRL